MKYSNTIMVNTIGAPIEVEMTAPPANGSNYTADEINSAMIAAANKPAPVAKEESK